MKQSFEPLLICVRIFTELGTCVMICVNMSPRPSRKGKNHADIFYDAFERNAKR